MIEITPFKPSDSSEVVSFMNNHFGLRPGAAARRRMDFEHFSWKYGGNCYGPTLGFLCKQDGKVVGIFSAIRKLIHIRGEDVPAFEALDAFVAPDCQGQGIFSKLGDALHGAIDKVAPLVYGVSLTPINAAIHEKKYGAYRVLTRKSCILVLDFRNALSGLGMPRPLSAVVGPPGDALMGMLRQVRNKGEGVLDDVREIDAFPADYDDSCERIWSGYDFAIVKNRNFLEWRYVSSPEPYHFCECKLKNGDTGYFIWKPAKWRGLSVGYIIDILADLRNPEMVSGLVAGIVATMEKEGIDIVSIELNKELPIYRDLARCGFFPRMEPLPFMVRQTKYEFLKPNAPDFDRRNWRLLPGDGDNI